MTSPEKRCLYEVLGLSADSSADEIRSAYKRLALQRHPDKLVQSGLSPAAATASFQELVNAYEVLSDPRERAWYDSHRSQILFSDPTSSASGKSSPIPDLFSFFSNSVFSGFSDTGQGFYRVYADVFDKVYANEVNFAKKLGLGLGVVKEAPVMGNLGSPYSQMKAFYDYWLGFMTLMDFCWVDKYDAMAGVNRKSRRVMEDENKKLRKKARREYNETVRGLAEFAKKRDKRFIDMMVKKEAEMERKREEERERKREREREKAELAQTYEDPEWARVDEEEMDNGLKDEGGNGVEAKRREGQELYCVVCGKKFKSDKQWKNHEQSKKHKEKALELRESLIDDDDEDIGEEDEQVDEERVDGLSGDLNENGEEYNRIERREDGIDELNDLFREDVKIEEEENGGPEASSSGEDAVGITKSVNGTKRVSESLGSDDENSVLEAMISGHRSRTNAAQNHEASSSPKKAKDDDVSSDNVGFMEYHNRKSRRRKKEGKRGKGKGKDFDGEPMRATEENGGPESSNFENPPSHSSVKDDDKEEDQLKRSHKGSKQPAERKGTLKRESGTKSKNSSKGMKQKATSKKSSNTCGACGEDFESRTKLHKHLGATGHATLKSY